MKAQTKSVQVLKPLTREGRSYVRGERIEVTPRDALALRRGGFVTLTRGVQIERDPPPRRRGSRGTYRRRDMVPEPVGE